MPSSQAYRLELLDTEQLPVLPPGAPHLLQTLTDESMDFQRVAQVIQRFPTIAARLIRLANSAWSAPVSPVTSLEGACARLGFGVVRSTSIALAVAAPFDPNRCPAFDAQLFWCRALLVADVSAWLADATASEGGAETARAAGLLHNLGLLWLADRLPQATHQALQQHQQQPDSSLRQLLSERMGFDYLDAGRRLGEAWGLPDPLVAAMAEHGRPAHPRSAQEQIQLVTQAVGMAQAAERQIPWEPSLPALGIGSTESERIFTQTVRQLARTCELAQLLFGA